MKKHVRINRFIALVAVLTLVLPGSAARAEQLENNPEETVVAEVGISDTIDENHGTVSVNKGTINKNYGTIGANYGLVISNGTPTTAVGTVVNNYGTVYNQSNGTVTNNYGVVNSLGISHGTVTNEWNKLTISNPKGCEFSIASEGNVHTFTTGDVVTVTAGTATVTQSVIGYEIASETDISIEIRPAPQYSFTTGRSSAGTIAVSAGGVKLRAGAIVAEGTVMDITAKANDGYRVGSIVIERNAGNTTNTIQALAGRINCTAADKSISQATITYHPEQVPLWELLVEYTEPELTNITGYQWQKSTRWNYDAYGDMWGTDWVDIPGATASSWIVRPEELSDETSDDYWVCDYRVIITTEDGRYCIPYLLGHEYEPPIPTGGDNESVTVIPVDSYCTTYTAQYTMAAATANIFCDFVKVLEVDTGEADMEFGTTATGYEDIEPRTITFTSNCGEDKEIVLNANLWSVQSTGYEIVTPAATVLKNGETTALYVRPMTGLGVKNYSGYVLAKAKVRDVKTDPETEDTGVVSLSSQYILMKFNVIQRTEVVRRTPVIEAVAAATITYGQFLEDITVTGSATCDGNLVAGSFYLDLPEQPVMPDASARQASGELIPTDYGYTFVPDDTVNFGTVTGMVPVTVSPAVLTVSTESVTVEYTGQPVTAGGIITGFVNGESAGLIVTGSQTEAGSSANTAGIDWTNATAKESNYCIEYKFGTLTVNAKPNPGQGTGGGSTGGGSTGGGSTGGGNTGGGSTGGGSTGGGGFPGGFVFPIGGGTVIPPATPAEGAGDRDKEENKPAANEQAEVTPEPEIVYPGEENITVSNGEIMDLDAKAYYETSAARRVTFTGPVGKVADVEIPDVVTARGITYKITRVAEGAMEGNKKIKTLTIGDNMSIIERSAFKNCTNLKSVDLGESTYKLYRAAFYGCKNLESVKVSPQLYYIGQNCFRQCTKLKELDLPETLGHIGPKAFYGCKSLESLTIRSTYLKSSNVSSGAFKGISEGTVISVPKSKVKAYTSLFRKKGLSKKVEIKAIQEETEGND